VRRFRPLVGLAAGLALLLCAPLSALASTGPVSGGTVSAGPGPAGGVVGAGPYCARDFERLHEDHYIAYNDNFGSYTCLRTTDQPHSANFTVTKWSQGNDRIGAFPNIFAGWEYGRHPGHSWDPIADDVDGSPQVGVSFTHIPGANYNGAFDIWFNRTDPADPYSLGQNDGTELMIWLVNHTGFHPSYTVEVDGHPWEVMSWIAYNRTTGTHWHNIAFIAPTDISHAALWLNPFFDAATALGSLNPRWYLTQVSFGYELASGDFVGLHVSDFAVKYVGVPGHGPDQHNPKTPPPPKPRLTLKKQPAPKPKHMPKPTPKPKFTLKKQPAPKPKPTGKLRSPGFRPHPPIREFPF
jgi:hypothetical protein